MKYGKSSHGRNGVPTLSLCMIVKNEEEFLGPCLESVKDVADEMIIVDTGSTDRTVEIAESYGARVYHHAWRNSFSEARNYGLEFATCDWIFQLDADEELEREDIPKLWDALRSAHGREDVDALFVAIYNDLGGVQRSKHYFQRIFRRGKAEYAGIVHNQLVLDDDKKKAAPTEIRVYHYGYALSKEEMKKKHRRTGELLRQQLKEDPGNTFAQMNLIRILRNQELFDETIREGNAFLDQYGDQMTSMHRQMICNDVAFCLLFTGRYDEAEEVCRTVLEENPDNLDILFTLATIHYRREDYPEALRYYETFLRTRRKEEQKPEFTQLIVDTYTIEDKAWNNIGECHKNMGRLDEAIDAYHRAIQLNDRDVAYYKNLAQAHIQQKRLDKAEEVLRRAMELGIADVHFDLGELYRIQGDSSRAIEQYREAIAANERQVDARNGLAIVLMAEARLEEAEQHLLEAERLEPDHIGVLLNLARIESRRGAKEEAREYLDRITGLSPTNKDLSLDLAAIATECEDYDRAIELFEEYLQGHPTDCRALTDLSTCYARLSQYQSALIGYQAALEIDPRYQPARNCLAVLGRILQQTP